MDNKKNVRKAITASGKILSILAVLFVVLTIAMAGTASAKSLYLATHDNEIRAYDIGADGYTLTYQSAGHQMSTIL